MKHMLYDFMRMGIFFCVCLNKNSCIVITQILDWNETHALQIYADGDSLLSMCKSVLLHRKDIFSQTKGIGPEARTYIYDGNYF